MTYIATHFASQMALAALMRNTLLKGLDHERHTRNSTNTCHALACAEAGVERR
jgi:hypothetical protein